MGRGGEGAVVLAFVDFDASSIGVADVWLLAHASGSAFAFQAFLGELGFAVDQEGQRGVAAGQAVQLFTAVAEDLAIAGALTRWLDCRRHHGLGSFAVGGWHADALGVLQESFLAEASDDAVLGADRAGMGVGAGRGAGGSARVELFVGAALRDWWQHHERGGWDWVDLRALLSHDALAVGAGAEVSLLAGAAGNADTRAERVGVFAGAIAALALTEFLVLTANLGWQRHDRNGWHWGALLSQDALAVGAIAEVTFLAGAALDADTRADGVGVVAGAVAALALTEFLVLAAHLGWQRHGFGGRNAAGFRWYAHAVFVFQVAGLAEAADHALHGAHRAGVWVGAGRGAGGSAWHENFVFLALRDLRRVGEERSGLRGFALVGWHAEAEFGSQVTRLAEASDDAVLGADWARVGVGAGRGAGRAAGLEFLVVGALGNFKVQGSFWGFAFVGWHAEAELGSQETGLAEASDDAVLGADRAGMGIGAGRGAGGAAGLEFFVVGALGDFEFHGGLLGSGLAFLRAHAFTLGVLQESLLAETVHDALEGTEFGWFRIGAIRHAGGAACQENGISAAFLFWKSRDGDSEPEGANAEQ